MVRLSRPGPVGADLATRERSANPAPVCARGGCSELAGADSEWCARHTAAIEAARAAAANLLGDPRSRSSARFRKSPR